MIVAVKHKGSNKKMKLISLIAVIAMFTAYYFHMSDEFTEMQNDKQTQIEPESMEEKKTKSKKIEKAIYREVEIAVDLIGQEFVQKVKVVDRKILITCDANTNLEPLMVRYGTMALVKSTLNNVKVAIDLKYIAENRYNGQ